MTCVVKPHFAQQLNPSIKYKSQYSNKTTLKKYCGTACVL